MKHLTHAFLAVTLLASGSVASANDRDGQDGRYNQDATYDQDDRYDTRYDERNDDRYNDERYDNRHDTRYDNHYDNRYNNRGDRYDTRYARYDYARVIRVERLGGYDRDYSRQCYDNRGRNGNQSNINEGAVIGAIAGGAIGNQVGKGDGRGAATVAGALIGGLIGQSVDRDNRGGYERHYIECRNDYGYNRGRDSNYRVTYRYRDRVYSTIMPYHPGNNVRVRIDMRPQYDRRFAYRN